MTGTADKSPKDTFDELRTMVVDYAKQETLNPIKNLGRWVAFGFAGGLSITLGVILLGLGALRALQTQTSVFDGGWNFVPYILVFLILGVAIGLLYRAATKSPDPGVKK